MPKTVAEEPVIQWIRAWKHDHPEPKYRNDGLVGFGLEYYPEDSDYTARNCHRGVKIWSGQSAVVRTGWCVSIPKGFYAQIIPTTNWSPGGLNMLSRFVFSGQHDELFAYITNKGELNVEIPIGSVFAQLLILPVTNVARSEVLNIDIQDVPSEPLTQNKKQGCDGSGGCGKCQASKAEIDKDPVGKTKTCWPPGTGPGSMSITPEIEEHESIGELRRLGIKSQWDLLNLAEHCRPPSRLKSDSIFWDCDMPINVNGWTFNFLYEDARLQMISSIVTPANRFYNFWVWPSDHPWKSDLMNWRGCGWRERLQINRD